MKAMKGEIKHMNADWLDLEGKVIIVTGGSSGIGASIVEALSQAKAVVINADIHPNKDVGKEALFIKADVANREDVLSLVQHVIEKYKVINGLVNNAGINIPRLLVDKGNCASNYELDEAIFDKMINVNQKGVFLLSQAVGKEMAKQNNGVIINMSSECGLEGSEGQSCYAATKAAINGFTRSWAKELGRHGIRVVGVAPGIMEETGLRTIEYETALAYTRGITVEALREGYFKTSTIPLQRSGKLSEVADCVAYLLSNKASYITGVTINVAGGKTRG